MIWTQKFINVLCRRTLIVSERSATWFTHYNLYYFFFYHYFLYLNNLDLWIITTKQRKLEMGIIKQANQMPFTHITYIIYIREGIGITPLRTNISILHSQRKTLINAEKSHTWKLLLKKFSSGFLLHRYRNII